MKLLLSIALTPILSIVNVTQATQADVNSECLVYGKVIKVTDGDTVKVLDADHVTHKIRLAGIDAPERKQPFGKASGKYLAKLVNQQMVCIQGDKIDKYGRTVGVIMFKGLDINLELVATGYAWHYKKYQNEQSKLAFLLNLLQLPKIKSAY